MKSRSRLDLRIQKKAKRWFYNSGTVAIVDLLVLWFAVFTLSGCVGETSSKKDQEGEERVPLLLECEEGEGISISKALYQDRDTHCIKENTSTVRSWCEGRTFCNITPNNALFGDNCLGQRKTLQVIYECDGACSPKKYGHPGCDKDCPTSCSDQKCDPFDGACYACPAGTFWPHCDAEDPCEGPRCSQHCFVHCDGEPKIPCDSINSTCVLGCAPGYNQREDTKCRTPCSDWSYGKDCAQQCSENCAGINTECHHITGHCVEGCIPGYVMPMCIKECRNNTWGLNCAENCSEHCMGTGQTCNPKTGHCLKGCGLGFKGDYCRMVNCSENCKGMLCDFSTGVCTLGCVSGKFGPTCSQNASATSEEEGGSVFLWILPWPLLLIAIIVLFFFVHQTEENRNVPDEEHPKDEHRDSPKEQSKIDAREPLSNEIFGNGADATDSIQAKASIESIAFQHIESDGKAVEHPE